VETFAENDSLSRILGKRVNSPCSTSVEASSSWVGRYRSLSITGRKTYEGSRDYSETSGRPRRREVCLV